MINAACRYFQQDYGVDIHEENETANHTSLVIRLGKAVRVCNRWALESLRSALRIKGRLVDVRVRRADSIK